MSRSEAACNRTTKPGPMPRPLTDRFWEKVDKRGPDECWEWRAARHKSGYGQFKYGGAMKQAHRVAWELINGPIPKGIWVLHHCDNPGCVNPAHLFLGTHQDNMADMDAKGRRWMGPMNRGERNGNANLREITVRTIRIAAGTQREIAKRFNTSQSRVSEIRTGKAWGWLL